MKDPVYVLPAEPNPQKFTLMYLTQLSKPVEPNPQKFTTEVTLMYLTQLSKAFEFHNTLLKRFAGLT